MGSTGLHNHGVDLVHQPPPRRAGRLCSRQAVSACTLCLAADMYITAYSRFSLRHLPMWLAGVLPNAYQAAVPIYNHTADSKTTLAWSAKIVMEGQQMLMSAF